MANLTSLPPQYLTDVFCPQFWFIHSLNPDWERNVSREELCLLGKKRFDWPCNGVNKVYCDWKKKNTVVWGLDPCLRLQGGGRPHTEPGNRSWWLSTSDSAIISHSWPRVITLPLLLIYEVTALAPLESTVRVNAKDANPLSLLLSLFFFN